MGSIPLPALDVKAPGPQPDQMSQIGNLLALKQQIANAPLQQQNLQNQVQSSGLQVQQQQQALTDQKATTAAMREWDGKDINSLPGLVLKNGGSGTAVFGLKKNILDQQKTIAETAKQGGDAALAQISAQQKVHDSIAGDLATVVDPAQTPDSQLAQVAAQHIQNLTQSGFLQPAQAQQAMAGLQQNAGNPTAIRNSIDTFRKSLLAQSQITEQALKTAQTGEANANAQNARGKIDPTSPLYAPSEQSVALGTAPGAAGIQAGEVKQAARKAGAEESARMPGEMALARQRQALSQGDPNAAAQLLVNGDATLSELKARGATPEFIQQTLNAAHQQSGGKYNAQQADAAFQVAKSPAQVAFFGSSKSLTDPGGTLDQLAQVGKTIPANRIPAFNSISDWEKAATGSGPLAHYAATALGVADDYAKVMGGGTGSDTSRLSALNIIKANASPQARQAALQGIRDAVTSQTNSRIGNNPVLKRMYGDQQSAPAAPGPQSHAFSLGAWQKANPQGDPKAAAAAAQQAGYQVTQ